MTGTLRGRLAPILLLDHAGYVPADEVPRAVAAALGRAGAVENEGYAVLALAGRSEWTYEDRPDVLAEDDRGNLLGPSEREGWWEWFDPTIERHRNAFEVTRRTGVVAMVERLGR